MTELQTPLVEPNNWGLDLFVSGSELDLCEKKIERQRECRSLEDTGFNEKYLVRNDNDQISLILTNCN